MQKEKNKKINFQTLNGLDWKLYLGSEDGPCKFVSEDETYVYRILSFDIPKKLFQDPLWWVALHIIDKKTNVDIMVDNDEEELYELWDNIVKEVRFKMDEMKASIDLK